MEYAEKPNYDQYNQCDHLINNFSYFTVLESALIWCGISKDDLQEQITMCKPKGDANGLLKAIFVHPFIRCVEPRCRILHEAFDNGLLKMGRDGRKGDYVFGEKGKTGYCNSGIGHIAYERRTIMISDLKEYILEYHPNDMPKTLFSSIEINKAQPISNDDYLKLLAKLNALEAENTNLKQRLDKATEVYRQQKQEIDYYRTNSQAIDEKTEQSYLTTIGLLLELCQKKKYTSQAQIIADIAQLNIQGQKDRKLQKIFALANQILDQTKKSN